MDPEAYKKNNKPEAGAELGVYKHPDSDEKINADSFPAADAFVRQGFVKVGELPSAAELRHIQEVGEAQANKDVLSVDEVKYLRQQLKDAKAATKAAEAKAKKAEEKAAESEKDSVEKPAAGEKENK